MQTTKRSEKLHPVNQDLISRIITFLTEIGINVLEAKLPEKTFVPGIYIEEGTIKFDRTKLSYPGDLLHEAGHLALILPEDRVKATGDLEPGEGMDINSLEPGAILWSYLAVKHLSIEPKVVFHDAGYKGASDWYIENFESGNYIALPLLEWMGICEGNGNSIPKIKQWLRTH